MNKQLISIHNLSFIYPGAEEYVLKNINLVIEPGDFVAIVGGNGSGKTTFCKTLNGLIPHYYVGDFEGTVEIQGINTLESSVTVLAKKVGYVYQDYENQLIRPIVLDDVSFAPLNYGYPDYLERGKRALSLLGIEELADQFIWELSGGQKHLVALAGVLSLDPDVIIIDEPAAQLDPVNANLIYEKLKILNETFQKTIIVIEHHTEFIGTYCRSVIMMEKGSILWKEPVKKALNRVEELIEKNIYPPQITQVAKKLTLPSAIPSQAMELPVTLKESDGFFRNLSLSSKPNCLINIVNEKKEPNEPVIHFERVSQGYKTLDGTVKRVLNQLTLTFYERERIAIVGSNGAGKSTLLRMISGIVKPMEGNVYVLGKNTHKMLPEELSEQVTYIYQNPELMFINDSIRREIEYFHKVRKNQDIESITEEIITRFHLSEIQHKDGRMLSGGQQRRASLAIGMAMRPTVILLDEPTASLDIASRKEMILMLEQLKEKVKTAIIATHDMQLVAEWADRVLVMNQGKLIADGRTEEILNDPDLLKQAHLSPPQVIELSRILGLNPAALSVEECVCRLQNGGEEAGILKKMAQ